MTDATVQSKTNQPEVDDNTMRVALLVEECGASFHGSQYQPTLPTVQQSMQSALTDLNLRTSAVTFASRTDAGVNAHGQVAHFDVAADGLVNIPDLASALNAKLPGSIAVRAVMQNVSRRFHSRREAEGKWYRYQIHNGKQRSVWSAKNAAHCRKPLDTDVMNLAARLLVGRHDFKSFKDPDTHVTDDICTIQYANVTKQGNLIIFDVAADRFLYKMVRNIAGQLIAIGNAENPMPPETMLKVLAMRDRSHAAATANPKGLSLMAIKYPSPFNHFESDVYVRQFEALFNSNQMESLQDENLFRKAS